MEVAIGNARRCGIGPQSKGVHYLECKALANEDEPCVSKIFPEGLGCNLHMRVCFGHTRREPIFRLRILFRWVGVRRRSPFAVGLRKLAVRRWDTPGCVGRHHDIVARMAGRFGWRGSGQGSGHVRRFLMIPIAGGSGPPWVNGCRRRLVPEEVAARVCGRMTLALMVRAYGNRAPV